MGTLSNYGHGRCPWEACWISSQGCNYECINLQGNTGALILAETLPPQFTPRTKHYTIKTIRFREQIVKRGIKLMKIDATEQL